MDRDMTAAERLAAMIERPVGDGAKPGMAKAMPAPSSSDSARAGIPGASTSGGSISGAVGSGLTGDGDDIDVGLDLEGWSSDVNPSFRRGQVVSPSSKGAPSTPPPSSDASRADVSRGDASLRDGSSGDGSSRDGSPLGGVRLPLDSGLRTPKVSPTANSLSDVSPDLLSSVGSSLSGSSGAKADVTSGRTPLGSGDAAVGAARMVEALPQWMQDALKDLPIADAIRFASEPGISRLDKAIEGLDLETRVKVLRTVISLDIRPNDEMMVLLTLFGYIDHIADKAPREIRSSIEELRRATDELSDEISNFIVTFGDSSRKVLAETESSATRMVVNKMNAVSTEEQMKHRERFGALTERMLAEYTKSIRTENKKTLGTEWKSLAFAGSIVFGSVLFGFFGHLGTQAMSDRTTSFEVREGRTYAAMYAQMPSSMRSWVGKWVKTHSVPGNGR